MLTNTLHLIAAAAVYICEEDVPSPRSDSRFTDDLFDYLFIHFLEHFLKSVRYLWCSEVSHCEAARRTLRGGLSPPTRENCSPLCWVTLLGVFTTVDCEDSFGTLYTDFFLSIYIYIYLFY